MKGNRALSSFGVGLCVFSENRVQSGYEPEFNALEQCCFYAWSSWILLCYMCVACSEIMSCEYRRGVWHKECVRGKTSFYFIHHSACLKAAASAMASSVCTQVIHHRTKTQFLLAQHSPALPPLACYSPPAPSALRAVSLYHTAIVRKREKKRESKHLVTFCFSHVKQLQ